jgi:hypothetical protein
LDVSWQGEFKTANKQNNKTKQKSGNFLVSEERRANHEARHLFFWVPVAAWRGVCRQGAQLFSETHNLGGLQI